MLNFFNKNAQMSKHVCYVIDRSGSMELDLPNIIRCIQSTKSTGATYTFIAFENSAKIYTDVAQIHASGGTNIVDAFLLLEKQPKKPDVIVFISDGQDSRPRDILTRLSALRGILNCVFFTVAVGNGFPTSVALHLRELYNAEGLEHLPVTFALPSGGNFATFCAQFLHLNDHIFKSMRFEFNAESTVDHLEKCVTWTMTRCLSKCARYTKAELALQEIQDARSILVKIEQLLKVEIEETKPLASSFLKPSPVKSLKTAINRARENLNLRESNALQGILMEQLSDVEKKDALAFGNVGGKYIGKSLKLHAVDVEPIVTELALVLPSYVPNPSDDQIQDGIHLMTQDEIWTDAKTCTNEIKLIASPVVLIGTIGVVGRLFKCLGSDASQINPYLIQIVGFGDKIHFMNTVDFYKQYHGKFEDNQTIFPVGNEGRLFDTKFMRFIATFMVTKNMGLEMTFALAALGSAVVCYSLQNKSEFMLQIGNEALHTIDVAYPSAKFHRFASYIEKCKTNDFYKCLVNTYPIDDCYRDCKAYECEHLTKFVMALAMAIKRGHKFTTMELRERMLGLYREKLGREYSDDIKRFTCKHIPVKDALAKVSLKALDEFTCIKAIQKFNEDVKAMWPVDKCIMEDIEFNEDRKFYGLDKLAIEKIFTRLNEIQGNKEVFEITIEERKWALNYEDISSFQRNTINEIKEKDFIRPMQMDMSKEIQTEAPLFITELFNNKIMAEHMDLPTIPTNINEGIEISPITGLAFNACCFQGCKYYMVPLTVCKNINQKIRVSDELWTHLEPIAVVPGMHRIIKEEINTGTIQITEKIIDGKHILPSFQGQGDKTTQKIQQVKKAIQVNGGLGWLQDQVEAIKMTYN